MSTREREREREREKEKEKEEDREREKDREGGLFLYSDAARLAHERAVKMAALASPALLRHILTTCKNPPHGGARGFGSPCVLGCCMTTFPPHKALLLNAYCKLTFDERVVLHRVEGVRSCFTELARLFEASCKGSHNWHSAVPLRPKPCALNLESTLNPLP